MINLTVRETVSSLSRGLRAGDCSGLRCVLHRLRPASVDADASGLEDGVVHVGHQGPDGLRHAILGAGEQVQGRLDPDRPPRPADLLSAVGDEPELDAAPHRGLVHLGEGFRKVQRNDPRFNHP